MAEEDPQRTIQQLRTQVARLLSQNLELKRQIEDLRRAQAGLSVENVALSLVESVRAANTALAAAAQDETRFAVAQLDTTIRAGLVVEAERLALVLPRPELPLPLEYLGSVRLSLAQLPVTVEAPSHPAVPALVAALEYAQAAFSAWRRRPGQASARTLADLTTRLLSSPLTPDATTFAPDIQAMATAAESFRKAIARSFTERARRALDEAVASLVALAGPPRAAPGRDLDALADALRRLAQQVEALGGGP